VRKLYIRIESAIYVYRSALNDRSGPLYRTKKKGRSDFGEVHVQGRNATRFRRRNSGGLTGPPAVANKGKDPKATVPSTDHRAPTDPLCRLRYQPAVRHHQLLWNQLSRDLVDYEANGCSGGRRERWLLQQ
jgi:hypothetical protein